MNTNKSEVEFDTKKEIKLLAEQLELLHKEFETASATDKLSITEAEKRICELIVYIFGNL